MTKYGKIIAELVLNSFDHPTAEQIHLRMTENGIRVSMATVYNNLKSLTDEGIIHKISMDGSPDRFDKPSHHDHLVCSVCGKLADAHLDDMTQAIEKKLHLNILSYDLRIHYVCDACKARRKE